MRIEYQSLLEPVDFLENGKSSRNCSKHSLEDSKEKIRNLVTSYRRGSQYTLETKVVEVPDVGASRVGEGQ